jgi:hypothetical protein
MATCGIWSGWLRKTDLAERSQRAVHSGLLSALLEELAPETVQGVIARLVFAIGEVVARIFQHHLLFDWPGQQTFFN